MTLAAPCVVPFAVPLPEPGRRAWAALLADAKGLPHLKRLLGRHLVAEEAEVAAETSLDTPAERAFARMVGWHPTEGRLPFAALQGQADGLPVGDRPWGLLTPVHWHVGTEQVGLTDPGTLALDESESRAAFEAVQELFVSEGFVAAWGAPLRWYLSHESLADLRTASLDRVIGRNVDAWLGAAREQPALRRIHRLQAEMQMLLHEHPLSQARLARGLAPVNSFWLSGCGAPQPVQGVAPRIQEGLRHDALAGDWAAWAKAWELLDETLMAELLTRAEAGQGVVLVLCGERGSRRFGTPAQGPGWWSRLQRRLATPSPAALTELL